MKEIIISNYDCSVCWTIATRENGKVVRAVNDSRRTNEIERFIYDRHIRYLENHLDEKELAKELANKGYKLIVCEDGGYTEYDENGNLVMEVL